MLKNFSYRVSLSGMKSRQTIVAWSSLKSQKCIIMYCYTQVWLEVLQFDYFLNKILRLSF